MIKNPGLGTLLRQLFAMMDADVQAVYSDRGECFRLRFYPVARHLLDVKQASVSELADGAGVTQPAMTQTLQGMAEAGLIELSAADDGRKRVVMMTDSGLAAAERLGPIWSAAEAAVEELDAELPMPLADEVRAAIAALFAKSFRQRIEEKLS